MRITVTVKGDMEKYIEQEVKKTGLSSAMVLLNLAISGYDYKQALNTLNLFAHSLDSLDDKPVKQNET